jgi:hypothetical protein
MGRLGGYGLRNDTTTVYTTTILQFIVYRSDDSDTLTLSPVIVPMTLNFGLPVLPAKLSSYSPLPGFLRVGWPSLAAKMDNIVTQNFLYVPAVWLCLLVQAPPVLCMTASSGSFELHMLHLLVLVPLSVPHPHDYSLVLAIGFQSQLLPLDSASSLLTLGSNLSSASVPLCVATLPKSVTVTAVLPQYSPLCGLILANLEDIPTDLRLPTLHCWCNVGCSSVFLVFFQSFLIGSLAIVMIYNVGLIYQL